MCDFAFCKSHARVISIAVVCFAVVFYSSYRKVLGQSSGVCNEHRDVFYRTVCMECSMNALFRCPRGFTHHTVGSGIQTARCRIYLRFPIGTVTVSGCYHRCSRKESFKQCCHGFWGNDCQACPGNPVCSAAGKCFDKLIGNGTCSCQDGFKGTACELCTDATKYGKACNQNCSCQHGVCNSGVDGTGVCTPYTCQIGFVGRNCSERLSGCHHNISCSSHAECFKINGTDSCVCNPGYTGDGQVCTEIYPCNESSHGCHGNAKCIHTAPGRHRCQCALGYTGDGTICMVIDPCQVKNGGCPTNSTTCNFLGPNKSNCSCLPWFENYKDGLGCKMINLCKDGNRGGCDVNADCMMRKPGLKRVGYRGNGTKCYGNIIERVGRLNSNGPPGVRGSLTIVNMVLNHTMARPLGGRNLFTFFVPTDMGIRSTLSQSQIGKLSTDTEFAACLVRLHLIAADLDSIKLKAAGMVTTLQGTNATITVENNTLYYKLSKQEVKAKIISSDLLAGNGIIHIINKVMWIPGNYLASNTLTSLQVIQQRSEFSVFSSLLQLTGAVSELMGLTSPVTIFLPVNNAFKKLGNLTMRFLTTTAKGKQKLTYLLKNHIINLKIDITDLISFQKVISIAGVATAVQLGPRGQLVLGGKAHVIETNIVTSTGVIHLIDDVLLPNDILPLVPKYCNIIRYDIRQAMCYRCDMIDRFPNRGCMAGYVPSVDKRSCFYRMRYRFRLHTFTGCQMRECRKNIVNVECCAGFYSRLCHPCPGPLDKPCNSNGQCDDKVQGTGRCSCKPLFKGTACELCRTVGKFGIYCNQTCTCVHGICDDGIMGNGTCRPGTCRTGYHGNNCDVRDTLCVGSSSLLCHINAHCVRDNGTDVCKCNSGHEGSGLTCYEIDRCTKPGRRACHKDATCTKTGPGTNNCTCYFGFRGDGIVCVAIDPCKAANGGGCHDNAVCQYTGPGQSMCVCQTGYSGDGQQCSEINNCLVNNGGCALKAHCDRTGPATHNCSCNPGYIGNGYYCLGSIATVIQDSSSTATFYDFVKKANLQYYLADPSKSVTIFAPSSKAMAQLARDDSDYWTASTARMNHLIGYHLANGTYSLAQLMNMTSLPVRNGQSLSIRTQDSQVLVNNQTRVIQADRRAANGILHVIDKILLPPRLPPRPPLPKVSELLKNTSSLFDFFNFTKQFNLLTALDNCVGCTVFAPNNEALQNFVQNKTMTIEVLKNHVIQEYVQTESVHNGQQFSTWLGPGYLVKITDKSKVNGISFNKKRLKARTAVIYQLSGVLEPVKSRCDIINVLTDYTRCQICVWGVRCLSGYTKVWIRGCDPWEFFCRAKCQKTQVERKCCSGFWGPDCQACPGRVTSPCSGNGQCSDGLLGTGHCSCSTHFTGTNCEKCRPTKFGKTCSSVCRCVNGTCNAGITGDGSCSCYHGWKGSLCDKSANYTNCLPTICHTHASCRGSGLSSQCLCDTGFIGNGTHCRAINACDRNNGGCHRKATCKADITSASANCACISGYTGDGQYCYGIDVCQKNNGGCHLNATCTSTGPGLRNCFCKEEFTGDGEKTCILLNPCEQNNGGCSIRARCKKTGIGQRKCTCAAQYVGDGEICVGSCVEAMERDVELSIALSLIKKYGLKKLLESHSVTSVLAPNNKALNKLMRDTRKRRSVSNPVTVSQYLRYHIVSCVHMTNETIQRGGRFTSLLGPPIWIERNGSQLVFRDAQNNTARVIKMYESANGFVFKLDNLLVPPTQQTQPGDTALSHAEVTKRLGYTTSNNLLKKAGLTTLFNSTFGRPYLMFYVSDQAYDKLSDAFKNRLTDPRNIAELTKYVKYHVVQNAPANLSSEFFIRGGGGVEMRTTTGEAIFVSCRGGKGDLYVNGRSKIIQRDIRFNGGVAYGIDTVLLPLGLGGKCDDLKTQTVHGHCGSCFTSVSCPADTTHVGTTNHNCTYEGDSLGCQPVCLRRKREQKCCANFYGSDCRACPGGSAAPCSGRGQCDDGLTGAGRCTCRSPFNGSVCERCPDVRCPAPVSCNVDSGGCHVFATCSDTSGHVNCTCRPGYEGDGYYCQMIDRCNTNNGGCGEKGTCHFQGPGQRRCQCILGYYMINGRCVGHPLQSRCLQNHGGCSLNAACSESSGHVVCTCLPGYTGNGFTCEGNIIQVLEGTVKLTEFYKAVYGLQSSQDGSSVFANLQSSSLAFTVFAPINSVVAAKKFNLSAVKHHIVAGRVSLSHGTDGMKIITLLGTELMIRKMRNGEISVNGVAHVLGDIEATNGIIYVLDQVLPIIGPKPPPPTTLPHTTPPPTTRTKQTNPTTVTTTTSTTTSLPVQSTTIVSSSTTTTKPKTNTQTTATKPTAKPTTNTQTTTTTVAKPTTNIRTTTKTVKPPSPTAVSARPTSSKSSTSPHWSEQVHGNQRRKAERLSGGRVAAIIVCLVLALVAFAAVIWHYRKRKQLMAGFRYQKEVHSVQYNSDFSPGVNSLSYENPVFGDESVPGPDGLELQSYGRTTTPFNEGVTEFNNPLYLKLDVSEDNNSLPKDSSTDTMLVLEDDMPPGKEEIC